MKNRLLILSMMVVCFTATQSHAQRLLGSVQFKSGIPAGDFRQASGISVVSELSAGALYGIKGSPVFIGADLGYGRYGTAVTRRRDIFPGVNQGFRIRRNNNYVNLMGVVRLMPDFNSRFRPFLEGQIGGIHTFTRSRIRENRLADPIASGTEHYDWALMLQAGAGIMFAVNSGRDTFVELKVNYVNSGELNYLTRDSATYNEQGELMLDPAKSGFNMIQPSVGVKYLF
ncbi:hypothetical protein SAMN04488057_105389 [Cyclobacterium lianum]|uniref:Outer membrane protein beta-barrel domain-containing protein n=1 Tax=Cyclobacterium lianum TaxID=388280 RepID=A0A1M7NJN5_9BACT|nr:hypothetical protein [Cyclobacterium lianum]SHN04060.1 hypothetical protein SAMN04488057_105389 [Cyclobacterium lianum]